MPESSPHLPPSCHSPLIPEGFTPHHRYGEGGTDWCHPQLPLYLTGQPANTPSSMAIQPNVPPTALLFIDPPKLLFFFSPAPALASTLIHLIFWPPPPCLAQYPQSVAKVTEMPIFYLRVFAPGIPCSPNSLPTSTRLGPWLF